MTNFAFCALQYLGVNGNIWSEWRYPHNTFGGVGLLSLSTEATIARVNLFVQHWGMPNPIGQMLQTSMEALQLEIFCVGCPLNEPFNPMGPLVMHCWLRLFWEVVDKFCLSLEIDYPVIPFPCKNDVTIMSIAVSQGLRGDDLLSVKRCRLSSSSIFPSDIASANGHHMDSTRGLPGVDYRLFSTYTHPRECPFDHDWAVWEQMWRQYCYANRSLPCALGKWLHHMHRRWEWYYHPIQDVIVQRVGEDFWAHQPCFDADTVLTRGSNRYGRVGTWHSERSYGEEIVHLSDGPALAKENHMSEEEFWGFVCSWGGEWLWDHMYTPLAIDAMVDAIGR
jgi:hypothetical protein